MSRAVLPEETVGLEPFGGCGLTIASHPEALPLVRLWLPSSRESEGGRPRRKSRRSEDSTAGAGRAPSPGTEIRIHAPDRPAPSTSGPEARDPTFRAGTARVWVEPDADRALAHGTRHGIRAALDLAAGRAEVFPGGRALAAGPVEGPEGADPGALADRLRRIPEHPAWEMSSVLSAAAVLLLGRAGRTILHGGAAAPPGGDAWLLVGDGRSGKSSACAGLVSGGWDYLADDQLLLEPGPEGPVVEGWSRDLHLDRGWRAGTPTGERRTTEAAELGGGEWRPRARVAGVLLTRVSSGEPTSAEAASSAGCLGALIRQSPWLFADPPATDGLLALLTAVAERPSYRLRLGEGAFGDPAPLQRALGEAGIGGP